MRDVNWVCFILEILYWIILVIQNFFFLSIYIYIYITETFEAPTIFHISTIFFLFLF